MVLVKVGDNQAVNGKYTLRTKQLYSPRSSLASAIAAAIIMWLIGKRDVKQIVLVSVLVPLLMWFVFYNLLTVNIPMGVLQPLKNLVDML